MDLPMLTIAYRNGTEFMMCSVPEFLANNDELPTETRAAVARLVVGEHVDVPVHCGTCRVTRTS